MKFEYISEKDAPKAPKAPSKSAAQVLEVLNGLHDGQIAKVTPDEDKSLRGLKTSFGRVSKGAGIKIETWSVDGDESLYVKRIR